MSEILDILRDVPTPLAAAWAGWLVVGLTLLLWHLRARESEREAALAEASAKARVRPPSGVRSRSPKTAPVDAFAELEALLESAPTAGISRRPGD
jgi:hypothetical protein